MNLNQKVYFTVTGCPPLPEDIPAEYSVEKYPIVITKNGGDSARKRRSSHGSKDKVLLVVGYPNAKQLGRLNVIFNDEGQVSEWYGGPIRLDKEVEQGRCVSRQFSLLPAPEQNSPNLVILAVIHVLLRSSHNNVVNGLAHYLLISDDLSRKKG